MTIEAGRTYTIKEWFGNKLANEIGMNITSGEIFAVLKETEKAVYAMIHTAGTRRKTTWIPKSAMIDTTEEDLEDADGRFPLIVNDNYDEVAKAWTELWGDFR